MILFWKLQPESLSWASRVCTAVIACRCQTKSDACLTSLSGTHCGSSSEKGLLKAPFSGTMRRPLGLRMSFFPSGTEDIFLQRVFLLCVQRSLLRPQNSHLGTPFRMIDRLFSESEHRFEITCFSATSSVLVSAAPPIKNKVNTLTGHGRRSKHAGLLKLALNLVHER